PFAAGYDPRHHVERDQPFLGIVLAIDVEGDAGAAEEPFGFLRLAVQPARVLLGHPRRIVTISQPNGSVRAVHLVELNLAVSAHDPRVLQRNMTRIRGTARPCYVADKSVSRVPVPSPPREWPRPNGQSPGDCSARRWPGRVHLAGRRRSAPKQRHRAGSIAPPSRPAAWPTLPL